MAALRKTALRSGKRKSLCTAMSLGSIRKLGMVMRSGPGMTVLLKPSGDVHVGEIVVVYPDCVVIGAIAEREDCAAARRRCVYKRSKYCEFGMHLEISVTAIAAEAMSYSTRDV